MADNNFLKSFVSGVLDKIGGTPASDYEGVSGVGSQSPEADLAAQADLEQRQKKAADYDRLVAMGALAPETAMQAKSQLGLMGPLRSPEDNSSVAASNLQMAQQSPEAFDVMTSELKGTPVEQVSMPAPLAPATVPKTAEQAVAEEMQQAQAAKVASEEVQKQEEVKQAQVQHEVNQQKKAEDKKVAAEESVKQKEERGTNWGNIIGQAVAVGLGEYGRAQTGGQNLALATIERLARERAEKQKLDADEAMAARKMAYDAALLKLREEDARTDNALKKAQIAKISAEIGDAQAQLAAQQDLSARVKAGGGFTPETLNMLPEKDRERAVLLPGGKYGLALRSEDAKKLSTDILPNIQEAKHSLKRLSELADYFSNNPVRKLTDREAVAEAQALQKAVIGKMRLQLFGPGVLTDTEQKIAANIVRNPDALMTLASANKAAYNALMHKLDFSQRQYLRNSGIDLPPSKNEINIAKLKARRPGMSDAEAATILIQSNNWVPEE